MGNLLKLCLLFVLATIIHWAVATLFANVGISVNIMLCFAIAFCTILRPPFGYPSVFLCGLFLDFFNTKLFGSNACAFTICACLVYIAAERLDFEAVATQAVSVFGLVTLASCLNSFLIWTFSSVVLWTGIVNVLIGALISACIAPFIFGAVQKTLTGGAMCKPH